MLKESYRQADRRLLRRRGTGGRALLPDARDPVDVSINAESRMAKIIPMDNTKSLKR